MNMAVFLDESQGLLRHGAEVKKGVVYNKRGTYNLVTNPSHVSKGIRSVEVDGRPMSLEAYRANGIDIFDDGKPHSINVVMGS